MADKTHLALVPGLLCTATMWSNQIFALEDVARAHVVDHTQHESISEIAAAFLADAPTEFALAGLSMGGYIALEIVRQAPERVTRLALLDTSARADAPERRARRLELNALGERAGAARVQRELLPMLIHKDRLGDEVLIETILQMGADTGVEALKRQHAAIMGRADMRPHLGAIRCPTLVLVGREDALTPLELSQELAAGIPGAVLDVVPHCGHLSTMEQPGHVSTALRQWLAA